MSGRLASAVTAALVAGTLVGCSALQNPGNTVSEQVTNPELAPMQGELRTVAVLPIRPGNTAATPNGRVFSTIHPMDGDHDVQLIEVTGPHSYRAWPSTEVQTLNGNYSDATIDSPLGIALDRAGGLWITDMGNHLGKTRIWGFDIASGELIKKITLPADIAPEGSFIQDLVVDPDRGWIYLADIANPSLLAVDIETGETRRFDGYEAMQAQPEAKMLIDGEAIQFGGAPSSVGVNPLTLSNDGTTLFFGAMSGFDWYSVPTRLLRDGANRADITAAIERVGPKPISDGADTGPDGTHYFTNLNDNGVDTMKNGGSLQPLVRDERLAWPDSVRLGADGWLYVAVNQLHKAPPFTGAGDEGKPPYYIYKVWTGNDQAR